MLLINTFSPNMIDMHDSSSDFEGFTSHFEKLTPAQAYNWLEKDGFVSAISSKEVAHLFGAILQIPLLVNNVKISMSSGSQAILGLYKGPKIRNRQSRLTAGAVIRWYLVTID